MRERRKAGVSMVTATVAFSLFSLTAGAALSVSAESRADVGAANAGLESPFDATDKAKAACGLAAIDYRGTDRDWAPPSRTTPALIFSRDLMAWCRAYGPISPRGGGRLTVTFNGMDALVRTIEISLADHNRATTRRFEYFRLLDFNPSVESAYLGGSFLLQASHDLIANGKPSRKARELYKVLCGAPWERPVGAVELPAWSEPGSVLRVQPISHYGFGPDMSPPLTEGGGYRTGVPAFSRAGMIGGWRGRTDGDRQFVSTTVLETYVFLERPCGSAIQAEVAANSPYDADLNARVVKAYPNLLRSQGNVAALARSAAPRSVCERAVVGVDGVRFNATGFSSQVVTLSGETVVIGQTFLRMTDGRHFLSTVATLDTGGERPDSRCDTAIFS